MARACTFEVGSTRLTGVDQISEGEIIQGRRRDRDKALFPAYHVTTRFFFFLSLAHLTRPLVLCFIRPRSILIPKSSQKRIRLARTDASRQLTDYGEFRADGRIRSGVEHLLVHFVRSVRYTRYSIRPSRACALS